MAWPIAGGAVARPSSCSKHLQPSSFQRPSRGRRHASVTVLCFSQKQRLLLRGDNSLRQLSLSSSGTEATATAPSGLPVLRIFSSRKRRLTLGSKSEAPVVRSEPSKWDVSKALAVAEGVCIVVAAGSYTSSVFHSIRNSFVTSSSAGERKFVWKVGDFYTWYVPALGAVLVINAILRIMQRQASTPKVWKERSINDFTLDQRVGKLEEDVKNADIVARMSSKHLEKLGVRFREIKRSLRDPDRETVLLTQKIAEVVNALAVRDDTLEKELRDTQQVLAAMQEQQVKQLDLLVTSMAKSAKSQKLLEEKLYKQLKVATSSSNRSIDTTSPSESRKQNQVKKLVGLWKGLVENDNSKKDTTSSEKGKVTEETSQAQMENGQPGRTLNGHIMVSSTVPQKKKDCVPDTSFTKEDFWATEKSNASVPSDFVAAKETDEPIDGQSTVDSQEKKSPLRKIDSFFSTRKGGDASQSFVNQYRSGVPNPDVN